MARRWLRRVQPDALGLAATSSDPEAHVITRYLKSHAASLSAENHYFRTLLMGVLIASLLLLLSLAQLSDFVWWTADVQYLFSFIAVLVTLGLGLRIAGQNTRREDFHSPVIHDLVVMAAELIGLLALLYALPTIYTVTSFHVVVLSGPLQDALLASLEETIGLPHREVYAFVLQAGWLPTLQWIYASVVGQFIFWSLGLLFIAGKLELLWRLLTAITMGAFVALGMLYLFPALGPMGMAPELYPPDALPSWIQVLEPLKSGSMTVFNKGEAFLCIPSFHTIFSLSLIAVAYPYRWLFPLALVLNSVGLLATYTVGNHYLLDLVVGAVWFAGFLWLATKLNELLVRRARTPQAP